MNEHEYFLRIVMLAREIPDNAIVTMRTGEKQYTLRRQLRVFSEKQKPMVMDAKDGAVFLVAVNSDANVHDGSKELVWHATHEDILQLMDDEPQ